MSTKFIVKINSFQPEEFAGIEAFLVGDHVVAENSSGVFLGQIIEVKTGSQKEELPLILRKATAEDLKKNEQNRNAAKEIFNKAKVLCKKYSDEMKLLTSEYSLDMQKLILTFSSENRVDFRELVKDLAGTFKVRIELKQVGVRDEAKIIGGLGPCGRQCCCNNHLCQIPFTGVKMAKNQNLSLNPQKISGVCGRLMCCLSYENDAYAEALRKMPKVGSMVETPRGKGKVVFNDLLKYKVSVKIEKNEEIFEETFDLNEIKFNKNFKGESGDDE